MNFPGNDFAAVDIHDQVEIPVLASYNGGAIAKVSRPREFHPQPLAERCVNLSAHTAPIKQTHPTFLATSERTGSVALSLVTQVWQLFWSSVLEDA